MVPKYKAKEIDVEEVEAAKEIQKKERETKLKKLLSLTKIDDSDDIIDLIATADPKLAWAYVMAEKGAERAIMKFLMLMGSQKSEDETDKMLKMYLLKKLEEEDKERKEIKKILLPIILNTIGKIKNEAQYNDCVRSKMIESIMAGSVPDLRKIQEECAQLAQSTNSMINTLVPLLSTSLIGDSNQSGEGGEEKVDENELELI